MNGLSNAAHMNGPFYTPLSFSQTIWYIVEPSFICCQVHYSRTYVLILAITPGLDCETYCPTVSHVITLNVTAPLSYRILILVLKECRSMVFNFSAVQGIEPQLSRESYRLIE